MKISFYPEFDSKDDLCQFVHRATWYLYPLRSAIDSVEFFASCEASISDVENYSSDLLDEAISSYLRLFTEVHIWPSGGLTASLENCDYVFVWDESKRSQLLKEKDERRLSFEVVRVDHRSVQYADSFFLRFAEKVAELAESYKKLTKEAVDRHLRPLASEKVYLFGTGPNFSYVESFDFSDGLVIACNSMVVNEEMLGKLKPDIFVIADPIFHAGPSGYAASFRKSFLEVLSKHDCPVVVPVRDFHLYSSYFPESVVSRLIPIPFCPKVDGKGPYLNIFDHYSVTTTSNILTLFQIPLACSLGKKIYISGCDGRPLSHNNYFWSHNKSVQINDKMETIKKAHPAFFDISYDDYYENHINTLDHWICHGESLGRSFYNLTPSYIPSLQARTVNTLIPYQRNKSAIDVSVIIPVYCAEQYLKLAVDSIVLDCDFSYEVIIVDDFSEDRSLEIAKSLAEKYDGVYVYQNFYKKGVSGARNTGIDVSVGDYVCFLDADDFLYAGSLNARINKLRTSDEALVVHGTVKFVDDEGRDLAVEVNTQRNVTFKDCTGNPASFNTLMFKRSVLHLLRFDENLTNGEDWLAFAKVLRKGIISYYVPEGKAAYRIHANSTVIQDISGHEERLRPVVDWICGAAGVGEAHYLYREGLGIDRTEILLARKQNMLVQFVFKGQRDAVRELLRDGALVSKLKSFESESLQAFKVAFVRAFSVRLEDRDRISAAKVAMALECLEEVSRVIGDSAFTRLVTRYFEREVKRKSDDLRQANRLFAQGMYEKARNSYQAIADRYEGELTKTAQFNLKLCEAILKVKSV